MIDAIASRFGTGSVPGWPRHTGQTFVLGSSPNPLRQPQNIFVRVESSTWHSSPMTVSSSAMTRGSLSKTVGRASGPAPIIGGWPRAARRTHRAGDGTGPRSARVYVIWSTTYLAIARSNQTIPPLVGAAIRFLVAGGVLYGSRSVRGRPERRPADRSAVARRRDRRPSCCSSAATAGSPGRSARIADAGSAALDHRDRAALDRGDRPRGLPSAATARSRWSSGSSLGSSAPRCSSAVDRRARRPGSGCSSWSSRRSAGRAARSISVGPPLARPARSSRRGCRC